MEYWKINVELNHEWNDWWVVRILDELKMHLWNREYLATNFDKDRSIEISKNKFSLNKSRFANEKVISIFIKNDSKWKSGYGLQYPQIVKLIEDYFKINKRDWYLLETLNSKEDIEINKGERNISPLTISRKMKSWDKSVKPKKVEVVEIGEYNYSQTDIYKGDKNNFKSILDFWISCLFWINYDEIEEGEFHYHSNKGYFDIYCGSCIPVREKNDEFERAIKCVNEKNKTWNPENLKIGYLMRKDWNDKIYLMEFENEYIIHNWHTAK